MQRNIYINSEEGYPIYYDLKYGWSRNYNLESSFLIKNSPETNFPHFLEIGCGTGNHAHLIATSNIYVEGIDKNPFVLSEAKTKNKSPFIKYFLINFINSDDLDCLDSYDVIYSLFSVFQTFYNYKDLVAALSYCYNHLNSPGKLILEFLNPRVYYQTYSDSKIRMVRKIYNSSEIGCMFARNFFNNGLEHIILYYYIPESTHKNYFINHHVLKFYSVQEIIKALSVTQYNNICLYGDYDFSNYESNLSKHIIVVASKDKLHVR